MGGESLEPDVAVLGAGVSGLVTAWLLAERTGLRVVLVDGARDGGPRRTLSFWSSRPGLLDPLVVHSWRTLRVHDERGGTRDVSLHDHTYHAVRFADLQRTVKDRLAAGGHAVVDGRVTGLQTGVGADPDLVHVQVAGRRIRARWVVDGRFHPRDVVTDPHREHLLHQHVHGWRVRAGRDAFDPAVATLLDFRAPGPPGTAFFHVLPFSPREALVELVTFDPVDAEPVVRAHLSRTLGLDDVELGDHEAGVTPMTEHRFGWRAGDRVRLIGTAAGRVKPSTGYALTRIVEDAERLVSSLVAHGHPFAAPPPHRGYRFLDGVLLEVWGSRPEVIPLAFTRMFTRNPADRVLRFLDERASLLDMVRLVATLPKPPFVRAAAAWSLRLRPRSARPGRRGRR